MNITFEIESYKPGDKSVEITYTDENGFIYKRFVNIPYNSDGTIDEDYFSEICEGQLMGVKHKQKLGVITFVDPSEVTTEDNVGIGTTSNL